MLAPPAQYRSSLKWAALTTAYLLLSLSTGWGWRCGEVGYRWTPSSSWGGKRKCVLSLCFLLPPFPKTDTLPSTTVISAVLLNFIFFFHLSWPSPFNISVSFIIYLMLKTNRFAGSLPSACLERIYPWGCRCVCMRACLCMHTITVSMCTDIRFKWLLHAQSFAGNFWE